MLNREAVLAVFEKLDEAMTRPQQICLIGGGAVIGYGNPLRQTQDLDVWRPASDIDDRDFAAACRKSGMTYDPVGDDVEGVYVQMVRPGVVQLPACEGDRWATGGRSETIWSGTNLKVVAPPPEILIASKLVRAEDRDVDDAIWLIEARRVGPAAIGEAARLIQDPQARETAEENLTLLVVVLEARRDDRARRVHQPPESGKEGR